MLCSARFWSGEGCETGKMDQDDCALIRDRIYSASVILRWDFLHGKHVTMTGSDFSDTP